LLGSGVRSFVAEAQRFSEKTMAEVVAKVKSREIPIQHLIDQVLAKGGFSLQEQATNPPVEVSKV
jgi:hypothetical protein